MLSCEPFIDVIVALENVLWPKITFPIEKLPPVQTALLYEVPAANAIEYDWQPVLASDTYALDWFMDMPHADGCVPA
jgi:hypothetical protein